LSFIFVLIPNVNSIIKNESQIFYILFSNNVKKVFMKKFSCALVIGFILSGTSFSQTIKIDSINSSILKRKVATTIILPSDYDTTKIYPVLYFLHWWGGDNNSYLSTSLITEMKNRKIIIVTPNADTCWYVNSFSDTANKYEDFLSLELFKYIDKKYKTDSKRQAIGGFSMGGYGAVQIGLKHTDRFKYIASVCGAINAPFYDIPLTLESPLNFIINSVRLSFGNEKFYKPNNTNVFSIIKTIKSSDNLLIYLAVAKQDEFDFIVPQHKIFIKELESKKIKYLYNEFDGGHFDGKVLDACLSSLLDKFLEI